MLDGFSLSRANELPASKVFRPQAPSMGGDHARRRQSRVVVSGGWEHERGLMIRKRRNYCIGCVVLEIYTVVESLRRNMTTLLLHARGQLTRQLLEEREWPRRAG